MTKKQQRAWLKQWTRAGEGLDRIRTQELAALSPEQSLSASDALLSLIEPGHVTEKRRITSGLVTQQRLFHRLAE